MTNPGCTARIANEGLKSGALTIRRRLSEGVQESQNLEAVVDWLNCSKPFGKQRFRILSEPEYDVLVDGSVRLMLHFGFPEGQSDSQPLAWYQPLPPRDSGSPPEQPDASLDEEIDMGTDYQGEF